jgi:protein-tyrosine sulfotransferase
MQPNIMHKITAALCGRPIRSQDIHPVPFFIIGSGRSGTTLLRAMLAMHSDVHIPPETYVLGRVIRNYKCYSRLPWNIVLKITLAEFEYFPEFDTFDFSLSGLYQDLLHTPCENRHLAYILHQFYMSHARLKKPKAVRWGDKTPINTFNLDHIQSVFPEALYVHLIRDGRDVISSCLQIGRYQTIEDAANRWLLAVNKARAFGRRFPKQYMEVKYEELIFEPKHFLQDICQFLELDFQEDILYYYQDNVIFKDIKKYSHLDKVSKPIESSSVGRWREYLNAKDIMKIDRQIGKTLETLCYK